MSSTERVIVAVALCAALAVLGGVIVLLALRRSRRAEARRPLALGAHLEIVAGPARGATFRVAGTAFTIGSAPGNDAVLADAAVSRRHCELGRTPAGWRLVDAGAANGVWVNGRRVRERVLVPGDRVRVGETELAFRLGPGPGTSADDSLSDML
jgi:pSer/pThr/pTyr-binding forkhead associated (FHA) protein